MKNKSVHCIKCTKVIFIITKNLDFWKELSMVLKCPECKTLQHVSAKTPEIEREIKVTRLDSPPG